MAKPPRLRAVTETLRSSRSPATAPAASVRSGGRPACLETEARAVPWMAFNATRMPSPVSDSAPSFGPTCFLLGSNLPWVRYGFDIGASTATPSGGLHAQPEAARELDEALARLRRDGVEHARVFLFCDGRAGIHFSADGMPEGLDESVFEDVDVLLATAERHRIGLMLVLFDAGLVAPPGEVDGVRTGGHADVLDDSSKREALVKHILEPLLVRYGSHPAIDAWDIFDEPECATEAMHCPHPARSSRARRWGWLTAAWAASLRALGLRRRSPEVPALVPSSAMRSFLGAAVQAVHAHTRALATVGLASTANLALVEGLGLDFYQAHWWAAYGDAPLRRAAADFRLDRPLVLGAFPTSVSSKSVKTVLDTVRCAGYGGAFLWSLRAVDSRGAVDGQLAQWARNHAAQLYRRPPRVEAAAEPAPVLAVEPVAEAALVPSAPQTFEADDEQPRSTRLEPGSDGPGLAAAPA
jgi:hypothetical protein